MLPIINLEDFRLGDQAKRQAIAEEIGAACESVGFLYVANHQVPTETIETAEAAARAFFALPEEEKCLCARQPGRYRGYVPPMQFSPNAGGRPPVRYEAFLVGQEIAEDDPAIAASGGMNAANIWPARPEGFRDGILGYWHALTAVAETLLRAFALALRQDEDRLRIHFRKPLTNISLLHYFPRPDAVADARDDSRAHYDTNALTIVRPGAVGGLEAQMPDGRWTEVPPRPGCFVVNIGNMMQSWSGGRFRSTMHRVHPPMGKDRYSIAYFATPDYDTLVEPLAGTTPSALDAAPIHAGEDLRAFVALFD